MILYNTRIFHDSMSATKQIIAYAVANAETDGDFFIKPQVIDEVVQKSDAILDIPYRKVSIAWGNVSECLDIKILEGSSKENSDGFIG